VYRAAEKGIIGGKACHRIKSSTNGVSDHGGCIGCGTVGCGGRSREARWAGLLGDEVMKS